MMQKFAYHFHAYQPGDIIYIHDGTGWDPIKFSERLSPVTLKIRDEDVKGRNWTRAMIKAYDYVDETLMRLEKGAVSVDIEPFTLYLVLRYKPKIYGHIVSLLEEHVEAVPTTPFHPIMPHLSKFTQEVLARISFDFYSPFIKDKSLLGYWLPEGVITRESARIIRESSPSDLVFLLDERQFRDLHFFQAKFSCNTFKTDGHYAYVFGRDHQLSDAFAFNQLDAEGLIRAVAEGRLDMFKESQKIPYLIYLASDLEALVSNPTQLDKFMKWIEGLRDRGVGIINAPEFIRKKKSGEYRCLEGECTERFEIKVKDYSSWSDYFDLSTDGTTSDTRWLGVRREDNRTYARTYRGKEYSQLWKLAITKLSRELNRSVRYGTFDLLKTYEKNLRLDEFKEFLVRYARIFFREHYEYFEMDTSVEYVTEPVGDVDPSISLKLGRIYYLALLGNHSCPRFWEHIDTRVTFGNVVALSKALSELITLYLEEGREERAQYLFLEYMKLLSFPQLYYDYEFFRIGGIKGWESSEAAWFDSLRSLVPNSTYNVVTRAALYVAERDFPRDMASSLEVLFDFKQAVPDTGHIPGELHGKWENQEWCEHRGKD